MALCLRFYKIGVGVSLCVACFSARHLGLLDLIVGLAHFRCSNTLYYFGVRSLLFSFIY